MNTTTGRTLTRYRLNENEKADIKQIAGKKITKNWVDYENPVDAFKPYIRTKARPNGIIDTQIYSVNEAMVIVDSKQVFESVEKIYSREELGIMSRDELIGICLIYGINPVNKADHFLAKLILQKQHEMKADISEDLLEKEILADINKLVDDDKIDIENTETEPDSISVMEQDQVSEVLKKFESLTNDLTL